MGVALAAGVVGWTQAPQDFIIDTFDTDTSSTWNRWWGSATQSYVWDSTTDANTNANSGSLEANIGFDITQYQGDNQFALVHYFGQSVDGTLFTNLVFDLRFDKNSATRPSGDFGYFEYGLVPSDYSQIELSNVTIAATNTGWNHIVGHIDPTAAKLTNIVGVWFKIWAGDTSGTATANALTGNTTFWLDNVELIANTNTAPPPPPTLALQPAVPGLQIFASAAGAQYQRQNISTINPVSWVGASQPVTYAVTITNFPGAAYSGFQAQVFLVPFASTPPAWETSPDWNEANCVFFQIVNNADGTASGSFHYKTNQPNGNSMLWNTDPAQGGVGSLASINASTPLGTWSLGFSNNTSITVTTPDGTSTNFTMPSAAAALFADPLYAYFGIQPNNAVGIGQSATFSRVQISGVSTPVDDHFNAGALNSTVWQVVAQDPAGVQVVPANSAYWLSWTLPANGYNVLSASAIGAGGWTDAGLTNILSFGGHNMTLITSTNLPGATTGFFQLQKLQ
jgi:hypothetical protein